MVMTEKSTGEGTPETCGGKQMTIKQSDSSQLVFDDVNLSNTSHHNANMAGMRIDYVNAAGARLSRANMAGASFADVNLSNCEIENCNVTGLCIDGVLMSDLLEAYKTAQPSGQQGETAS